MLIHMFLFSYHKLSLSLTWELPQIQGACDFIHPFPGTVDKSQSLHPCCKCGFDRSACGACGEGFAQQTAAGRKVHYTSALKDDEPGVPAQFNQQTKGLIFQNMDQVSLSGMRSKLIQGV